MMEILISLIPIFVLGFACVILVIICNSLLRRPSRIVYYWGLVFLCEILQYSLPTNIAIPLVTRGLNAVFISLFMADVIFVIMFVTLVVSICKNRLVIMKTPGYGLFLLCCVVTFICIINTFRGLSNFTDTNWLADVRNNFRFIIPIMYLYWYRNEIDFNEFVRPIKIVLTIAVAYTFVLWGLYMIVGIKITPQTNPFRVISPQQIVFYGYGAMFYIYDDLFIKNKSRISLFALVLSACVLLDQFRTVWISFTAGFTVIVISYIFRKEFSKRNIFLILQISIIIVIGLTVIIGGNSELASNFNDLQNSFSNLEESSWKTRTDLWEGLLNSLHGVEIFIGQPFGSGYDGGIGWTTSPHSGWIEIIMRTGAVGIVALLLVFVGFIIKSRYSRAKVLIFAYIIAQILYFIGYSFTIDAGFIIGLCLVEIYKSNSSMQNTAQTEGVSI